MLTRELPDSIDIEPADARYALIGLMIFAAAVVFAVGWLGVYAGQRIGYAAGYDHARAELGL